jgi:catechol 2,3-dioxygenase-like lactoylglutathione lyase family enzyme
MLSQHNAAINLAVKDLAAARRFYEEILGLTPVNTQPATPDSQSQSQSQTGLVAYRAGTTALYVYVSKFAGTNQATACTWSVGNELEAIVSGLKAKGVAFEHYPDLPGVTLEGDIHVFGGQPADPGKPAHAGAHRIVWFKDPAGNILSLINK